MPATSATKDKRRARSSAEAEPAFRLRPEWIRPKDAVHVFAVSRSKLYEWIAAGKLRTKAIGGRGSKKPIRLISYDHLARFIENLPDVTAKRAA